MLRRETAFLVFVLVESRLIPKLGESMLCTRLLVNGEVGVRQRELLHQPFNVGAVQIAVCTHTRLGRRQFGRVLNVVARQHKRVAGHALHRGINALARQFMSNLLDFRNRDGRRFMQRLRLLMNLNALVVLLNLDIRVVATGAIRAHNTKRHHLDFRNFVQINTGSVRFARSTAILRRAIFATATITGHDV